MARPIVAISDAIDRLTEACYVATTVGFASVMLVGVFFRYVLNDSLSWSDELALILFVWATFFSISSGYLHGAHVSVEVFVGFMPDSWRPKVATVAAGLAGGYLISLLVSSIQAMEIAKQAHTDALRLPHTIIYLAIPISTVLMLIHWVRMNSVETTWATAAVKIVIAIGFFWIVYLPIAQYVQFAGGGKFAVLALAFLVPMVIGVPVAFSLGLVALTYVSIVSGVPFNTAALQLSFGIEILAFLAIPLLILSGSLMNLSGTAKHLVDFAQVIVGRIRGGLGTSNVVASYLFGDITGSVVSDTATIGSLMIPEMKRRGYRAAFCAALQGASGTLAFLAPFSITLLMYSSAINTSVSRMAAATILPGLVLALVFILVVTLNARRYGYPKEPVPRKEVRPRIVRALPGLFAAVLVVGGILGGIFTPAELGAILLAYVLLLSVALYRTAEPRTLYRTTIQAGYISGMTLLLAATSGFLGFVLARDFVGFALVDAVSQLTTNKYMVILLISLIFIILGTVLEAPAIIFGFLPSFVPLLQFAKVDLIQFGILFALNMGIGMLIPPVALNLFISSRIAAVPYGQAVRAAIPFVVMMAIVMAFVAVFPYITLLIPNLLFDYPIR